MRKKKQSLHNYPSFWPFGSELRAAELLVQNRLPQQLHARRDSGCAPLSGAYQNDDWINEKFRVLSSKFKVQSGQALITLLFFMIIAITITSAAVVVLLTNSVSAQKLELGTISYYVAESGAENALLRLLRDPDYTGETLIIDGTTVVATVSKSGSDYTVASNATFGNFKRTVQVTASFVNNILTISSWKEVF